MPTMRSLRLLACLTCLTWLICLTLPMTHAQTPLPDAATLEAARAQVFAAERAFARSMAERRHDDFVRHLAEHTVFFNGRQALHGRAAVAAAWKPYYDAPQAPFSWEPDQVEVMADAQLALSSGLVRNPAGQPVARFNSIWRQEAPGVWRVVFDKGSPLAPGEGAGGG